jgi:adenylosuccinate lyase
VWDTATALQLRDSAKLLLADVDALIEVLAQRAVEHKHTLIMGRTHGVHAEPTTFGLKLALWLDEMRRNRHRLVEATEQVAVGKVSGAVGTHATVPLDVEEETCKALGIGMAPLSNQIIQRDRHAYFVSTLAVIAASLEKFATEIRGLQRTEVHEVEEPFGEGQTGSSAMPHKRNPELSERVCGLARLIRGFSVTALENVALWHERDISHSSAERIVLPDACMALDYILDLFTGVMRDLRVFPKRMMENIESTRGLVFSQRVMLALVEKGMAREEAYRIAQRHSATTWEQNADFRDLVRRDAAVQSKMPADEIAALFDYGYYTRHVDALFARVGLTAKEKVRAATA